MSKTKSGILNQLKDKAVDLLSVPVTEAAARSNLPPAQTATAALSRGEFERALSGHFTTNDVLVAGKVQLLDLQAVRRRTLKKSHRLGDSIDDFVQHAIERHLTESDFYAPYKDNYLIAFGELSKEQAQLRCGLIAEEISRWLFGNTTSDDVAVKTTVAEVHGDKDLKGLQGTEAIALALERAEMSMGRKTANAGAGETLGSADLPLDLQFFYRPMWHVRQKVVSTFECTPAWSKSSGQLLIGDEVLRDPDDRAAIADLDVKTLCKVIDDLHEESKRQQRRLLALRVHYSTLSDKNLLPLYLELWRQVPKILRQTAVVELVGLPKGVPNSRILEMSLMLKPLTRARIVCLDLEQPDFNAVSNGGFFAVGADLRNHAGTESKLIQLMENFAEKASQHGLSTCIHGLDSLSLTTAAVCAGFHFIDGDGITTLIDAPKQMYPLDPKNLYRNLVSAGAGTSNK
jgi:hypothetical protein